MATSTLVLSNSSSCVVQSVGVSAFSPNCAYQFMYQTVDSNLVVYSKGTGTSCTGFYNTTGSAVWAATIPADQELGVATSGSLGATTGTVLCLQSDGNLVLYSSSAKTSALWARNPNALFPAGSVSSFALYLDNGGNLFVANASAPFPVLYYISSLTPYQFPSAHTCTLIAGGGSYSSSTNACNSYTLTLSGGKLNWNNPSSTTVWSTSGSGGTTACMGSDGNLVVYQGGSCSGGVAYASQKQL